MKLLITGSHGFIGSVLVPMLLAEGHEVTALDFLIYGQTTLAECCANPRFHPYRVDCRDMDAVRPHVKDADVVIPLAGLVGVPLGNLNPVDAELLNLKAQLGLFNLLSNEQLVVMPTTESSYGSNLEVCDETTPLNPLSTYALHKVAVEDALMARGNSISLRLATVFGMSPRPRLDLLVNDFAWKAYSEHSILLFEHRFLRTVVHVRDVARAFLHCLEGYENVFIEHETTKRTRWYVEGVDIRKRAPIPLGIYNVGAFSLTKMELCDAIKDKMPHFYYTLMPIGGDPDKRNYEVSSEKLKATGFEFTMNLSDGLDELFKGFRMLAPGRYRNA